MDALKFDMHAREGRRVLWLNRIGPYATIVLAASVTLLVWLGAFHYLSREKTQLIAAAQQNTTNLARAFEEQISRSILAVDQVLLYARNAYANNPAAFDVNQWARAGSVMRDLAFQISIVDKNGLLVASNLGQTGARVDISDREHFKVQVESRTDRLFISKPVIGRLSGKASLNLTRRVTMPDGSFGGVVVISLDPEYLTRFYDTIDIGERGAIALVGTDGIVRARSVRGESAKVGESITTGGKVLEAFARRSSGTFTNASPLDGIERVFSYRGVRDLPLVVLVGVATSDMFAGYEGDRTTTVLIAGGLTAWFAFVCAVMLWYQNELSKARKAAEAGTRARSKFLAMISHELRTPMNAVIGVSSLLLDTPLNEEQRKYVQTINLSGDHLLNVINEILDFSRLEANRGIVERRPFQLVAVVDGTVTLAQSLPHASRLDVDASVAADVPNDLIGDPVALTQVLLNFLSNAVKHTDAGKVTLRVLLVSQSQKEARIRFAVEDTGSGIAKEEIPRLFKPFEQIERQSGGTGLGLAISKRLVDLQKGRIGVDSEVGKGSTFWCELPFEIGREEAVGEQVPAPVHQAAARGLDILVAEDVSANQLVIRAMLEKLGHRVQMASDGAAAIDLVKGKPFDLILMDIQMPVMDGYETTRIIRRMPGKRGAIPIVALTAYTQQSERDEAVTAGMNGFLRKPLRTDDLIAVINGLFGVRSTTDPDASAESEQAAILALQQDLGSTKLQSLFRRFAIDARSFIDELRKAVAAGSIDDIRKSAHRLGGLFGQFGAADVAAQAAAIEEADDGSVMSMVSGFAEQCSLALSRISQQLRRVIGETNGA